MSIIHIWINVDFFLSDFFPKGAELGKRSTVEIYQKFLLHNVY